ncbi:MAG: diadenylate cyclase CdaA [Clostridiales bacterium]|nr:diadenylate cyclase CdaA [Clostridiales bacterium]
MSAFSDILNTLGSGLMHYRVIWDTLDILIIAYLLYRLIVWTRETRAFEVLKGIGLLFVCSVIAQLLQLQTLNWLLDSIVRSGSVIIILFILFTPEIRRVLESLGRSGKRLGKALTDVGGIRAEELVRELRMALQNMARRHVGALLVFEQRTGLEDLIATGTRIDGLLSDALLENIFEPNTPLHDGAVIVRGETIAAAGCFLPLSDDLELSRELGTRHRAAVGVSTVSDALVFVVSEETGAISLARDGKLIRYLDEQALTDALQSLFARRGPAFSWSWKRRDKDPLGN